MLEVKALCSILAFKLHRVESYSRETWPACAAKINRELPFSWREVGD